MKQWTMIWLLLFMTGCQGFVHPSVSGSPVDPPNTVVIGVLAQNMDALPGELVHELRAVEMNTLAPERMAFDALLISRDLLAHLQRQIPRDRTVRAILAQKKVLLVYNATPAEVARQLDLKLSGETTAPAHRYVVASVAQLDDTTVFGGGVLVAPGAMIEPRETAEDIRSHVQEVLKLQHRFFP